MATKFSVDQEYFTHHRMTIDLAAHLFASNKEACRIGFEYLDDNRVWPKYASSLVARRTRTARSEWNAGASGSSADQKLAKMMLLEVGHVRACWDRRSRAMRGGMWGAQKARVGALLARTSGVLLVEPIQQELGQSMERTSG